MKKIIKSAWAVLLAFAATVAVQAAEPVKITSPNNKISVDLKTGKGEFGWTVSKDGQTVYSMEDVWLSINGKTLGGDAAVKNVKTKTVNETFKPVVPLKFSTIENNYTEATVNFGAYTVELRVMDNAVAYRFVTKMKGEVIVDNESFTMIPESGYTTHFQPCSKPDFNTSFEERYQHMEAEKWVNEWANNRKQATVPMLLSGANDTQLLIGESDVDDYPRVFLRGNKKGITTVFPKAPLGWEPRGDRSWTI
ncbi:MAG: glycoside hydrolase family 97 N-terminal domain-containing protein, partial [Bacteroidaceae bacterium]|nr:glycoside hydrolase family 97 N-terminal domain-containing protein [Bacteroidaceae bacterium]